jgi:hypothetical protein
LAQALLALRMVVNGMRTLAADTELLGDALEGPALHAQSGNLAMKFLVQLCTGRHAC